MNLTKLPGRAIYFLCLFLFSLGAAHAQLFSIDINGSVRPDVTEPGFMPWFVQTGLTPSSDTQSFTNLVYTYDSDGEIIGTNIGSAITCTVTMTVPATADSTHYLNAGYANKDGNSTSTDPNSGWRLAASCCFSYWKDDSISVAEPNTNGGAISLTITGLSAGVHSVTTYHNNPWWPPLDNASWHAGITNMSRCIISVNGAPVYTNTPSLGVTNDTECGFAFFYITNSYDGQPVVLNFDPDHSSALDFTVLNGFEIDRLSPPGTSATAIYPAVGFEHAFANNDVPLPNTANAGWLALQWQPAGFAISNYLYFGTNSQTVANATTASTAFVGATAAVPDTTNSFNVTNLNSMLTYYWRVDQLDVNAGVTNLVKGAIWEFRTRHLAFPTAEGYGRWARGGRGGVVIEVTNLNDSGPGSYRAAIGASGPRTVVFTVSGIIWLQSQCVIGNGYLTIAGQTSPSGICIANWRAGCDSPNDVIIRYLQYRIGDHAQIQTDAMSPGSASDSIFDHLTSSWSLDVACNSLQTSKVGSGQANVSYQHNIISEPLRYSYHYQDGNDSCTNCFQPHAFAASIGGEIGSYHHNLITHSTDRNWSLAGGLDQSSHYAGSLDIRNNVVYNWYARTTDGGAARVDYENNYYKPYSANEKEMWLLRLDPINPGWGSPQYYMAGNTMETKNFYTNNWQIGVSVPVDPTATSYASSNQVVLVITNAEIYPSYVNTTTASNAYEAVLSDVGCDLPIRDLIDQRVIGEVLDGTYHYEGTNGPTYTINGILQTTAGPDNPGFIDSQTDVKDYQSTNSSLPNYSVNAPWPPYNTPYNSADFLDTDQDGLPDWWEQIKGLNVNSPPGDFSDANADLVGDGYTELDRYLNWLALPHYDCTNGTTLRVDLNQYTRGFTNRSPSYVVFNATNGSVSLNGRTAQFTPNVSTNALGSFMFKVTDSKGFSYTNTVNVHLVTPVTMANTPPVLPAIASQMINVGVNLLITNNATDADIPAQTLTYTLPTAPTNASLGSSSGILAWRPLVTQANSTNPFSVVVTDNGTPPMSTTQSFNVTVNPLTAPVVTVPMPGSGLLGLSITGQIGPDYGIQGSTDLVNWNTVLITNPTSMPFIWSTNVFVSPQQFYRIKLGPPLP